MNQKLAKHIDRFKFVQYMSKIGWQRFLTKKDDVAIFQYIDDAAFEQIIIPLKSGFSDESDLIAKALDTVSRMTGLSAETLFLEIMFPKADILNFCLENVNITAGTLLIDEIVIFYNNIKKMLNAAAMDVTSPKLYHVGRSSIDAKNFIDACRFGQTEIGSYKIPVICPEIHVNQNAHNPCDSSIFQGSLFPTETMSLSRRIEIKLLENIEKIKSSVHEGSFDEDMLSTMPTMSTAFLNSVYSLIENPESKLTVRAHWNAQAAGNKPSIDKAEISGEYARPIKDVVSRLKVRLKRKSKYTGRISELKATEDPQNRSSGQITLRYMDSDKIKQMKIQLSAEEYKLAVRCHDEGLYLTVHTEPIEGSELEKCIALTVVDDDIDDAI